MPLHRNVPGIAGISTTGAGTLTGDARALIVDGGADYHNRLVPAMLAAFLESDRNFMRAREAARKARA
ncbi:hypothetical protein TQ38_004780 [Novosphingobium sp. P6W]|nr:hypothetical protein TQ38_004780 [Novosphingobium sp. P6W]